MEAKKFYEEFEKLNKGKFDNVFVSEYNTLYLDEDMSKWSNDIKFPEGYSFGSDSEGTGHIYNENNEIVCDVSFTDFDSIYNDISSSDEEDIQEDYAEDDEYEEEYSEDEEYEEESKDDENDEDYDDEYDLEDKEVEEVSTRNKRKKGILYKLSIPFRVLASGIKKLYKKITNKKEYDLEDKTIEEVSERNKKGFRKLFGKKNKKDISKIENNGEIDKKSNVKSNFNDLTLEEKLMKFLEGTNISDEELLNLYRNIEFIRMNDKESGNPLITDLHTFLNKNKDMEVTEKKVELIEFVNEKCYFVANRLVVEIADIFKKYNLQQDEELVSLFKEVVSQNNFQNNFQNIQNLYDFVKENDNEYLGENVKEIMYSILGKTKPSVTVNEGNSPINRGSASSKKDSNSKNSNNKDSNSRNSNNKDNENNTIVTIEQMNERLDLLKEKIEFKKQKLANYYEEHIKDNKKASKKEYEKYGKKLAKIKELENEFAVLNTKLNALKKFEAKKIDEAMNKKYETRSERAEKLNEKISILENEVEFKKQKLANYYEEHIKDNKKASMKEYEKYGKKLSKVKELETELSILKNRKNANYKLIQSEYENMDFDGEVVKRASL